MKRIILASLSALTLGTIAAPALAGEVAAVNQVNHDNLIEVLPFNLVQHGYQGYFAAQGIPSNAAFLTAVKAGNVSAQDLVQGAIKRGRLSTDTFNDQSYLRAVEDQLRSLEAH